MTKLLPSSDDIEVYLRCLSRSAYMWGEADRKDAESMYDMPLNHLKRALNHINIHLPLSVEGLHKELFEKERSRKINELKTAIKALEECMSGHEEGTFNPEKINLSSFGKVGYFLTNYVKNRELAF